MQRILRMHKQLPCKYVLVRTVFKLPYTIFIVLIRTSFAAIPVNIATPALQSPNPKGANIGATICPNEAKKLSFIFSVNP